MRPPANSSPPECPECGAYLTRVVCTKNSSDAIQVTVRRRQCLMCMHRFYTTQKLAPPEIPIENGQVKWVGRGNEQQVYVNKTVYQQDPTALKT
jgi:transcriptional regulator NrdR family protein